MQMISIEPKNFFHALSDPTRIRIVRLLMEAKGEACLCELADSLEEPEYKLSRHVKVLKQAGLLHTEKDGRWIYHRLTSADRHLSSLFKFIVGIPDSDRQFEGDSKRFAKRKMLREGGRCRTEVTENSNPTKRVRP